MTRRNSDYNLGDIMDAVDKQAKALGHVSEVFLDRIEALEARSSNSGLVMGGGIDRIKHEHKELFENWVRKSNDPQRMEKLQNIQNELSKKDVTIGSDIGGGFAVPEMILRDIEKLELKYSPVRDLVRVVNTSTSDFKALVSLRGAASGWIDESGTRTATATPTLRQRTPTHGEIYAYPKVSNWALDDVFFDVSDWLANEVAEEFAFQEEAAVLTGNGTNRPTGILTTTPTLGEDHGSPLRDADTIEYVVSDTDVDASPSSPGVRFDSLIDLYYRLNSRYRPNSVWAMNSTTAGAVRKLKNSQGDYLWRDALTEGTPPLLLGRPVRFLEQMSDVGAGNFPILFGDFRRAYLLVNRTGLRIIRDEVTQAGFTKFYISRREGGTLWNNDSLKALRTID